MVDLVSPLASVLGLNTLPLHTHEIIGTFCFYSLMDILISPALSTFLFPKIYPRLPAKTKINWDIHVVSLVQSLFINSLALWVMWVDEERKNMNWEERIWGYTGAGGMVQAFAAGYFLWDLLSSAYHINVQGLGALVHAISAVIVIGLGFRPFANYYGLAFILYELSTPFLNVHWFLDKLNMTGSRAQFYNGIALLTVFCLCRLVWGVFQSVSIYHDLWKAMQHHFSSDGTASKGRSVSPDMDLYPAFGNTYQGENQNLPIWLVITYIGSNTILVVLNFYWFGKMVTAVSKRFKGTKTRRD
ncbi:hypothetical protein MMC11_007462 [Xylographa trunciseda]|nr:hypothetical protein [Xylographa trunciseda]